MIPETYREFFVAATGASGTLIGLLFVAITVAPERAQNADTRLEFRVRSSAALLLFSNALVLSLAALVPGVALGWWSLACSLGLLAFSFATARTGFTEGRRRPGHWRVLVLAATLMIIVAYEVDAGFRLLHNGSDLGAIRQLNYVIIADLAVGISRAWQLANMHETGLLTSLRILAHGDSEPADGTDAGPAADSGTAAPGS